MVSGSACEAFAEPRLAESGLGGGAPLSNSIPATGHLPCAAVAVLSTAPLRRLAAGQGRWGVSMLVIGALARISGPREMITVVIRSRVFFLILIPALMYVSIKYIGFDLIAYGFDIKMIFLIFSELRVFIGKGVEK